MDPVEYKRDDHDREDAQGHQEAGDESPYRTDLARKAIANLKKQGLDVNGKGFKKSVVKLKLGGK